MSPKDWIDGLQFSVDYFRIRIKDAIQQANVTDVEDGCRIRNDPADCAPSRPATSLTASPWH